MKCERSRWRRWPVAVVVVAVLLYLSSSNVLTSVSPYLMNDMDMGTPFVEKTLGRPAIIVNETSRIPSSSNTNAVDLADLQSTVHGNESLTVQGPGTNSTHEEQASSQKNLLFPPSYEKVITWQVSPNFTIFDFNPYRQFCRWRNGDKNAKQRIARIENWVTRKGEKESNGLSLLDIRLDCYQLLRQSPFGTGNWVQMLYLLRLAVAGDKRLRMDLRLSCNDNGREESLVLPWLMGHFSSERTMAVLNNYFRKPIDVQCHETGWSDTPIGWMTPFIRQELRRMAIALVGIPDSTHPASGWVHQYEVMYNSSYTINATQPLLAPFDGDDVVIHFRCGDTMTSQETYFRFLKFHDFASRIHPDVQSIGIVTQPFGKSDQARARDQDDAFRSRICRRVILGFQSYLQSQFSTARVRIHNDANETVVLAYARLIMARRQAFAFPDSSFSVFPALASFAMSYHLYPLPSPYYMYSPKNKFLVKVFSSICNKRDGQCEWMKIPTNNTLFGIESLHMKRHSTNPFDAIYEWFVNETMVKPEFPDIKRFNLAKGQ